jgi:hypothetical protein
MANNYTVRVLAPEKRVMGHVRGTFDCQDLMDEAVNLFPTCLLEVYDTTAIEAWYVMYDNKKVVGDIWRSDFEKAMACGCDIKEY